MLSRVVSESGNFSDGDPRFTSRKPHCWRAHKGESCLIAEGRGKARDMNYYGPRSD